MHSSRIRSLVALVGAVGASAGCSSSNGSSPAVGPDASAIDAAANGSNGNDGSPPTDGSATEVDGTVADAGTTPEAGQAQVPPTSSIEAWLAAGAYKNWSAEPAVHASRNPSPHGFNRIYSNTAIATLAATDAGTVAWPVGAAAVKELYASATDTVPVGYAVYLKTADDTDAGGAAWYWYERVPLTSAAPHDDAGIVANGFGTGTTPANAICVKCHAVAGSDANHTPSPGGHDEVYTPVSTATDASADTPPMGGANVEAWLATGAYKAWASEPAIHASRTPSPHGFNRIYSNSLISLIAATDAGTSVWPVGAAAVKELYTSVTDTTPVGYAVYLKTADDTDAGGAAWYWYERVPLTSTAPHDDAGVVADGLGTGTTPAYSICVNCHAAAGSNAMHTPSPGGHDEVYTPVP